MYLLLCSIDKKILKTRQGNKGLVTESLPAELCQLQVLLLSKSTEISTSECVAYLDPEQGSLGWCKLCWRAGRLSSPRVAQPEPTDPL